MNINRYTIVAILSLAVMLSACSSSVSKDDANNNNKDINAGHSDNFITINNRVDNTSSEDNDNNDDSSSSSESSTPIETNSGLNTDGNMADLTLDDSTEETNRYTDSLRSIITSCIERHKNNRETGLLDKYKAVQSIDIGTDTNEFIDSIAFNDIMSLCIPSGKLELSINEDYSIKEFKFTTN